MVEDIQQGQKTLIHLAREDSITALSVTVLPVFLQSCMKTTQANQGSLKNNKISFRIEPEHNHCQEILPLSFLYFSTCIFLFEFCGSALVILIVKYTFAGPGVK